ncbi:MAG: LysM peptidoglycan-binding domain-containing protein [Wenzhouxiangella sp.]|nr:LysM peptidoglycan-binding domain-containing protein [Wenzhouxiangella sp.]
MNIQAQNSVQTSTTVQSASTSGSLESSYQVRSGDTLSGIAARFGVSTEAMLAANPNIANPNLIYPGDQLALPVQQSYTVQSGDTLSGIASRHGLPTQALINANPQFLNPNQIYPGDTVNIPGNAGANGDTSSGAPSGGTYTVRAGDTLGAIASRHGVSLQALLQSNPGISNPNIIHPGQTLQLPAGASSPAPSTGPSGNANGTGSVSVTPGELPDTSGLGESEKFDLYAGYIREFGEESAINDLDNGRKVVLSLRVDTNTKANNGQGVYDDRMVVVWQDGNGVGRAQEFVANTDPSAQYMEGSRFNTRNPMGQDVNGDGRRNQGRLADGTYTYTQGSFLGDRALMSGNDQISERDTSYNGYFDNGYTSQRGNFGMHVHIGGTNNTFSAGCLTLPPEQHAAFFDTLAGQNEVRVVMVNTDRLPATEAATPPANGSQSGNGSLPALGSLSEQYESNGNPGAVSSGAGDPGGISYGAYQLPANFNRPEQFLATEGAQWASEFGGSASGTAAFSQTWQAIAAREPDAFMEAQHAFIQRTHYDPVVNSVASATGVNVNEHSRALQNVTWSTAVQHGAGTSIVTQAVQQAVNQGIGPDHADFDRVVIEAVYAERGRTDANGTLVHFRGSSADVRAGVANRFQNELSQALNELGQE